MTVVVFSMAGEPRGKGRPRTRLQGRGERAFAQLYTDAKTREYERSVKDLAGQAMGETAPFTGPMSVSLQFRIAIPKSYAKGLRARILAGEEPYFGAFDVDNLAKSILDGMNAVVFLDDKQITRLFVTKVPAEKAGVDVRVEALCELPSSASGQAA